MNQPPTDSDLPDQSNAKTEPESRSDNSEQVTVDRIIKRYGGRHLIFRMKTGGWWMIPKPYALVSSFRGPVWAFYGLGQIWLTHRKLREIGGWLARVPRLGAGKVEEILVEIEPKLAEFIEYCNGLGIEGTVVIEKKMIEFHWTFGYELEREKLKPENAKQLDEHFHELVDAFLAARKKLGL